MTEQKPKIGFIGLGLMGSAMVQRLQSMGYELTVMAHRNRTPIDEAVARGAAEAATPAAVAQDSDLVMLCVDTTAAVESVMRGDDGVLAVDVFESFRPFRDALRIPVALRRQQRLTHVSVDRYALGLFLGQRQRAFIESQLSQL